MLNKYIQFPDTPNARQAISQRFSDKYRIPGVIGCIDCSHFRIHGPPKEEEHQYYCRKHYHSLNVQMVCDDEYRILNVNAKFGALEHDDIQDHDERISTERERNSTNDLIRGRVLRDQLVRRLQQQ
ncbi:unnamed protein product, partial [Brenthis ino]